MNKPPAIATVSLSSSLRANCEGTPRLVDRGDGYGATTVGETWRPPSQASPALKAEAARALEAAERALAPASAETMGRWLASLGLLCAGAMAAQEARAKIGAYASLMDYPPACFTKATLREAGRRFKWLPSYAELAALLDEAAAPARALRDRLRAIAEAPLPPAPPTRRALSDAEREEIWRRTEASLASLMAAAETMRRRPALPPVHTRSGPFDPGRTPGEELRSAEAGDAMAGEGPWPDADA
ncbi:MAG TPA: hypothetical protein VN821_10155 [Candidatus Udaeobacter sp.]|nr:hypothetical protein [Candidatus Udaeobacter sp.]